MLMKFGHTCASAHMDCGAITPLSKFSREEQRLFSLASFSPAEEAHVGAKS